MAQHCNFLSNGSILNISGIVHLEVIIVYNRKLFLDFWKIWIKGFVTYNYNDQICFTEEILNEPLHLN